jgi:hypothetical protein
VVARTLRGFSMIALVLVPILAGSCTGGSQSSGRGTTATNSQATIRELGSIQQLKEMFNHDAGTVRLILLISPT